MTGWRFLRDRTASMTTQVVIFSVLLFGAAGLVLDFGRVYSEHSRMQAHTDQAALAAAAELDGRTDAIKRATRAVFGADGGALSATGARFSDGESGRFRISHLLFLSALSGQGARPQYDLSADIGGPNLLYTAFADGGGAGDDIAAASARAKYVVAVIEERSVRNTLLGLINTAGGDIIGERNVLRTIAAARRRNISCGGLSNLVICNPWEDDPGASFASVAEDPGMAGVQFRHSARIGAGAGSLREGLFRHMTPGGWSAIRNVCENPPVTLGWPDSGPEAETARIICYLAAAREATTATDRFCVGDRLAYVPVTPEEITTALSTAFDMWDWPISAVLASHVAWLFQPDLDILKGRIWNEDMANAAAAQGRPLGSRRNHPRHPQFARYNLNLNACLRSGGFSGECLENSQGQVFEHISAPTTNAEVTNYYIREFEHLFQRDGVTPAPEIDSFYKAHIVERLNWLHNLGPDFTTVFGGPGVPVKQGHSLAAWGEDGSLPDGGPAPAFIRQLDTPVHVGGVRQDLNGDGAIDENDATRERRSFPRIPLNRGHLRRVFNVTVVNCGGATAAGDGAMEADVAGFAKMFLLQPPVPLCADGTENCDNSELRSSTVYSEFVGPSDMDERPYAVLAR